MHTTDSIAYFHRKTPRCNYHDYSGGDYFVTICTKNKEHFFGEIVNKEMRLSPIGKYCNDQIEELCKHYPYCEVPLFVVMPNHLHVIISIIPPVQTASDRTHEPCALNDSDRTHEPCVPTQRTALSVVIGGLKRAVTMFARRNNIDFEWQPRYHDHIIRGTYDGVRIADYIENNVAKWDADCFKNKVE